MTEPKVAEADPFEGMDEVASRGLERVAIRTRESSLTLSAWRLGVSTAQGDGVIFLVETPGGGVLFRGDGVFLGWPQPRLEDAYRRLLPQSEDASCDVVQGG